MTLLALDIGGANLKAADNSGTVRSRPFPLWKEPENLADALRSLAADFPPPDRVAVTMTGELCDCFRTKSEGVDRILDSVEAAFPEADRQAWGTDGQFHPFSNARSNVNRISASNWSALALVAARLVPNGLLIDVGSTTTDIIPLRQGKPVPTGLTDTDRLRSGELIYAGVKRTPLCALATKLKHRGQRTGLMAELFATTYDVYVSLRNVEESPADFSTADGRPATIEFARERLARMVGADRDGFPQEDALELARQIDAILTDRLGAAARRVSQIALGGAPKSVVVSGSGRVPGGAGGESCGGGRGTNREPFAGLGAGRIRLGVCLCSDAPGLGGGPMSENGPTVVVKVGGSLMGWPPLPDRLARFLRLYREAGENVVLIAGGGGAADWVRGLDRAYFHRRKPGRMNWPSDRST